VGVLQGGRKEVASHLLVDGAHEPGAGAGQGLADGLHQLGQQHLGRDQQFVLGGDGEEGVLPGEQAAPELRQQEPRGALAVAEHAPVDARGLALEGDVQGTFAQLVHAPVQHVLPGDAPEGEPGLGHGLAGHHHAQGEPVHVGPVEEAVPLRHPGRHEPGGQLVLGILPDRRQRPAVRHKILQRISPGRLFALPQMLELLLERLQPGQIQWDIPGRKDLVQGGERLALR